MSDLVRKDFFRALVTELNDFADWKRLGVELRVSFKKLIVIEKENNGNVQDSTMEMLDTWLDSNPDSNWEQVVEALDNINKKTLAHHLREKYVDLHIKSAPTTDTQQTSSSDSATTTTTEIQESAVATTASTTTSEAKQKVVIELSRFKQFSHSFDDVQREFFAIEAEILSALKKANACVEEVVTYCRSWLKLDSEKLRYKEGMDVHQLFDSIRPHYSYLKYKLLEEIVRVYLKNHQSLIEHMDRYYKQLQYFKKSTELKELMISIENAQTPPVSPTELESTCTTTGMCKVELTFVEDWLPCSIENLEALMKEVFKKKASVLDHLEVLVGSVKIIYYAPALEANDLIARVLENLTFMSNVGICSVKMTVAGQPVFRKKTGITDAPKFSFRASLFKAVENNDIRLTSFLLTELKINPNDSFYFIAETTHATALFVASQQGLCDIIDLLLTHEAEVNTHTEDGRTPLMVASKHGHVNAVKRLLEGGAYLEERDMDNDTALRYAVEGNQVEVVRVLLEKRADPNVVNKEDWTCLLISCCDNYHEIVNLLLIHGAKRDHVSSLKKTCLMMASQNGHLETMRILLKDLSNRSTGKGSLEEINQTMDEGWCALSLAYDHPEAVELLLEYGADPNIPLEDGWTTLMLACEEGYPKTVTALLRNEKTKVDATNNFGVTAYGIAQLNKNKETMCALREAGANTDSLSFAKKMAHKLIPSKAKFAKKEKSSMMKRIVQTAIIQAVKL